MTTVYLIRHAEAEGNLYRIVQGQGNSNLTDRGWRQVKALEQRFREIPVDAVYTSDLYRTCATSSAIYKAKGLPVIRRQDLREIGVGQWEHRTWGDIYRTTPEQIDYFSHKPSAWSVPGGEPAAAVLDRMRRGVTEIAAANEGRTVAIFSHGYAIRLLLGWLQGCDLDDLDKTPTGDNTAVSCLAWEDGALRILFRDDNSHLKTPEFLAGEKPFKRLNALEPGLWFRPLSTPEEREFFPTLAEEVWPEIRDNRPFSREALLSGADTRTTLVGYLREQPVGLIQIGPEPGWVSFLCMRKDFRKQGFGVQLIGQAVLRAREQGCQVLRAAVWPHSPALRFFTDCGFRSAGESGDGRILLEMNIAFDPEFL